MQVMEAEHDAERESCYASALSEHPDPTGAATDVATRVLERLGPAPDLAVVFVTPPHRDAMADIADVVSSVLRPAHVAGRGCGGGARRQTRGRGGTGCFAVRRPHGFTGAARPPPCRVDGRRMGDQRRSERGRRLPIDAPRRRSVHVPSRRVVGQSEEGPPGPDDRRRHGVGGERAGRQPAADQRFVSRRRSSRRLAPRGCLSASRRVAGLPADRTPLHRHPRRRPPDLRARRQTGPRTAAEHARAHVYRAIVNSPSRGCTVGS